MNATATPTTPEPFTADSLAEIESLYDRGRYITAHTLAVERHGPLAGWSGDVAALVLGGRLVGNVGGDRLSDRMILRAYRRATLESDLPPPTRASAALFQAYRVLGHRGPLALRRFLRRPRVRTDFELHADDPTHADAFCLRARVAAAFRDAETADALWQQAHALAPDRPWTWCERAGLLVSADRYDEALNAARKAVRLSPWYRPAVQQVAQVLTLLGRDEEAVALLEEALDPARGALESPAIAAQLAAINVELLRPREVLAALERFERLSPLLEDSGRQWVASVQAEARLQLGDLAGSADAAEPLAATSFFFEKTVPRLRDTARQAERHVILPVPFVRQHERTCAPATLSALTHFWQRPADHQEIAREICYGGTFDHRERHWAETHGWAVREFRVDWPGTVALIDAGIPFTLATTGINSGHLQAIIGYDARRGTFVIRDPYLRNQNEALAEEFLALHAPNGPRGMALVPADDPAAVASLRAAPLLEEPFYDGLYRLRRALEAHDRSAAHAALDALEGLDPAARLTLTARRELAVYDGDDSALLDATGGLLALYPQEGRFRLEKFHVLRRLARPVEARAWLEECAADKAHAEPNLWRELARLLAADAREHPRARLLLARCLFYEPTESEHLRALGELRWDEPDHAEAAALFRFAATSASVREDYWQQFFIASRSLGQADETLRGLDARFARLGERSSQPARTLFWARRERHEYAAAARVLDEALARRPDDGDLLLFAATANARDGEHARAADLLARARGHAAPGATSRAAAELADLAGDGPAALAHWGEVLAREPLDPAAHRHYVRVLAEVDPRGPAAVAAHLDDAVARFPHAVALHELRIGTLVDEPGRGSPAHDAAVAALLAAQPAHAWARRELTLAHIARHDLPAAFEALAEAERLAPQDPLTHSVRGHLLMQAGRLEEARASLRRALEIDADLAVAQGALLESSPGIEGQRASLEFIHGELTRQHFIGSGILSYRANAYPVLEEAELAAQLGALLTARPDVWQSWAAVVGQHADAGRLDQARTDARAAAERFSLLPRVWLDLAAVERLRGDDAAQIAALERALRIDSTQGEASRLAAAAHARAGRFPAARAALEQAIAAAPLDVRNRGALAEILWQEDRQANGPRALEVLIDAVRREPGYGWGWDALDRYARQLGQPETSEATARLLATVRPGEARSWMRLAEALDGHTGPVLAQRLDALGRALALNPRLVDAYDMQAALLASAGRYDEALAACAPPAEVFPGGTRPFNLDGRAAWVLATRGDLPGARERMRAVTADHPGYEWGWRMLADWAEAAGDQEDNLRAAERLAFLSPHAAAPLGYLAAAQLALGRRAEAKAALREATRRDAAYLYAPATLFTVLLEDKEYDEAEEILRFYERHQPGPLALEREVRLAAARQQPERAAAALTRFAQYTVAPGGYEGDLTGAVRAVLDAGWSPVAEGALHAALLTPLTAHPEAVALWVRVRADQARWKTVGKMVRRLPEGELARRARVAYLSVLVEHKRANTARWYIWRARRALRADTPSWGQAGYALTSFQLHRAAVRWLRDWRVRPDVEGWMLTNLANCLRTLGRHGAAVEVHRHALTLPPDHTRPKHLAWVALEEALTPGEPARLRAERWQEELGPQAEGLDQPYRYLGALVAQTLAVCGAGDQTARRTAYRAAKQALEEERKRAADALAQNNHAAARAERRAWRRMAREAGWWWWWLAGRQLFTPPPTKAGRAEFVMYWVIFLVVLSLALSVVLSGFAAKWHR